jgi:hypothetical protein
LVICLLVAQLEELPFDETLERTGVYPFPSCAGCHVRRFAGCALLDGPLGLAGDTSEERTDVQFGGIGIRLGSLTGLLDFALVNSGR